MISKPPHSIIRAIVTCILFSLVTLQSLAQQFKINQGIAFTQFNYKNYNSQNLDGLKSGSGLALSFAFHKPNLVDLGKYKLYQTPFAKYLQRNPKVAKMLSLINYDLGLQFLQLNALGNIQYNAVSYQTDYTGLHANLGFRIPMPAKFSLNLQGIVSASKIVNGSQLLMNQYVDLSEDAQFAQVKIMAGYGAEFEKRFSDKLACFFSYQLTQTLNSNPEGQSTLNFKPTVVTVGICLLN